MAVVFSMRWRSCLPFSGRMPSLAQNTDQLDVWTRYVIWAREAFSWPVSVIHGLNFPFQDATITRGPLPFFAFIFKGLGKISETLREFYYFPLVEMVFVFCAALFACMILDSFRTRNVFLKLAAAVLTGLSFPLLHRSSVYYGVTYFVSYVPFYLGFAYFYRRLHDRMDRRSLWMLLAFMAIMTSMFEHYLLFGIYVLFLVCAVCCFLNHLYNGNGRNLQRLRYTAVALFSSVAVTLGVAWVLGNQGDIDISMARSASLLRDRFGSEWGYGGGFGGGFHVADVLALVIPPQYDAGLPNYMWCGPSAVLTRMGFPLTTNTLQPGQYEGFSYLGTATLALVLAVVAAGAIVVWKRRREWWRGMDFRHRSSLVLRNELFGYGGMMCLGSFALFVLSWGYIIHIAGVRFDGVVTPSLVIAAIWPKFMFVRTMGRLAVPFTLFVILAAVIFSGRLVNPIAAGRSLIGGVVLGLIMLGVTVFHVYEVHGYLEPPRATVVGNYLAGAFGKRDAVLIGQVTLNKEAVIAVPAIRGNDRWLALCYSLEYYAKAPLNGYYSGLGVHAEYVRQNMVDTQDVMSGRIGSIAGRYGDIVIAAPPAVAEEVMRRADMPLQIHRLTNQDIALLTLLKPPVRNASATAASQPASERTWQ
ncbi:MAG: hypothetical protein GXX82_11775 [Syntrophorhabdus sp.]|nr:hypothetical protein [Syntrophorhabdus sp.]